MLLLICGIICIAYVVAITELKLSRRLTKVILYKIAITTVAQRIIQMTLLPVFVLCKPVSKMIYLTFPKCTIIA